MTQKLTEEQQRAAHKIIVANRGDCGTSSNPILKCLKCPNSFTNSGSDCFGCKTELGDFQSDPAFQAENLRRSQAWLDEHITDAETLAESPCEFCLRMVRVGKCGQSGDSCANCAKAYHKIAHTATTQEPAKRRPTMEEMVVGATVRVRLWDEMVRDGKLNKHGNIVFQKHSIHFVESMKRVCGQTYKIKSIEADSIRLDGCVFYLLGSEFYWQFTSEMLDYVEPEKVAELEIKLKSIVTNKKNPTTSFVVERIKICNGKIFIELLGLLAAYDADDFRLVRPDEKIEQFSGPAFSRPIKCGCDVEVCKGISDDRSHAFGFTGLQIIELEAQVKDLTQKLDTSTKRCDRLQRRLRANWEAKRDCEIASREEIEAWFKTGKGSVIFASDKKDWKIFNDELVQLLPATRANLKL